MKKTRHHRLPVSRGGGGGNNIVMIDGYRHELWHHIVGNATAEEVVMIFNELFKDYNIKFSARRKPCARPR